MFDSNEAQKFRNFLSFHLHYKNENSTMEKIIWESFFNFEMTLESLTEWFLTSFIK